MGLQGNLATEERLDHLTQQVRRTGSIEISAAAAELGVSEMTIRRDLKELEERGAVRRVRGGALAVGPQPFDDRRRTAAKAKATIAAKLADLVPTTGAVAFDASSTVMRLASSLVGRRDLVVLTNGPETFRALHDTPGVRPMLTGGELEPRTGSLVGPLACRAAGQLAVSHLFASSAAVDRDIGPTEACIEEAEVKRALAATARSVVLAVDASKLDARAVAVGLEWDAIDVLVTELSPKDARLKPYRGLAEIL
jgi:DeoR family fructose operon transcriptional repressor